MASSVHEHLSSLRGYARTLLRDEARSEDLVQETVARALSREHQFTPGTNLGAWLRTILHNQHLNDVRRSQGWRTTPLDGVSEPACPAEQIDPLLRRDLRRAMRQLPLEQRIVLLLSAREEMSYDEIASVLLIPVGTVRSRLSRARERLRRALVD